MLQINCSLTLLHSERPKLYTILAFLSAIGLNDNLVLYKYLSWLQGVDRKVHNKDHFLASGGLLSHADQ